ncbi:DUF4389 domain-containing protein [Enteractinococcus coprophilus]|uniref:Uncharacterized protein DUF4389 n=1 Tax=Enteractinococcus coprophilus TaxID=1027633 RepID=A0A543AFI9_9MICC|nr:DUF4389 domain-containing protein [Enteractinococcus coprophilus]TQL71348.1 uncharacterized protein DUF4389 [Enteractinococcus coprophilus]
MSTFDSTPTSPPPTYPPQPARMKAGHWVLLIIGVLLALLGLVLCVIGITAMTVDAAQRDGQYITFESEKIQTTGYAVLSPSVVVIPDELGSPTVPAPGDIANLQVRVTSSVPDQEIFVGIGPASDVATYLQDVPHSELGHESWNHDGTKLFSSPRSAEAPVTQGTSVPTDPTGQTFWTQSASGTGTQEITWDFEPGQWSLVIMNADASRPVWVDVQAGVRSDLAHDVFGSVGIGLFLTGLAAFAVGIVLLLLGAAGLGRSIDPVLAAGTQHNEPPSTVYPVRLTGHLIEPLSRWLWLVKWLLAIPHFIILALLGFALVATTIASGFTILFTARYPRPWFAFSVGVLRWTWRVGFYSYSALGTDRYPPFTLASVDYPADFDVAYPERLSRGLVLVKWWLLAIPHVIIVGILTTGSMGATWVMSTEADTWVQTSSGVPSLLGVLVLITALILLFTANYRAGLFALIMGINRWAYRVSSYVLLLRDDYPPFRLDQGPVEPPFLEPDPSSSKPVTR